MSLPVLNIEVSNVSQIGASVDSFFFPINEYGDAKDLPIMVRGQCYALEYAKVSGEAQRRRRAWHMLLLEASLAAVWYEKTAKPLLVGYIPGSIMRLFVLTKQRRFLKKVYEYMRALPGYIESGSDAAPIAQFRPIAYWDPPSSMIALWPTDFYGASPEVENVVDTGSLVGYFSYPETDHRRTLSVDLAGSDYVRVPASEWGQFAIQDRVYDYTNSCYQLSIYGRPINGCNG